MNAKKRISITHINCALHIIKIRTKSATHDQESFADHNKL